MSEPHINPGKSLSSEYKDNHFFGPGLLIIKSHDQEFKCRFDPEDYELISKYTWNLHSKGYAVAREAGKTILMHRLVMGVVNREDQVDHKFHDKLDNRKKKLRVCSCSENRRNSQKHKPDAHSKFKGVYLDGSKYHAQIYQDGKVTNIGRFANESAAARRYDVKARQLFKEFAYLNFPDYREPEQMLIQFS